MSIEISLDIYGLLLQAVAAECIVLLALTNLINMCGLDSTVLKAIGLEVISFGCFVVNMDKK